MIPGIVHQIWLQGEGALPAHIQKLVSSCKGLRGMRHMFWDEPRILALLQKHGDKELIRQYHKQTSFAAKADVARYVILYHLGGFYIDADYKCFKTLGVFQHADLVYVPSRHKGFVHNAFFACKPKHPVMHMVMEELKRRAHEKAPMLMLRTLYETGPGLLNDVLHQYHKTYPEDTNYLIVHPWQLYPCDFTTDQETCDAHFEGTSYLSHTSEGSWHIYFWLHRRRKSILAGCLVLAAVAYIIIRRRSSLK